VVGNAVAVGIAYFFAARLSLSLLTDPDGVAVFWPAAGVSAGILIAVGRQARWAVATGTMAATIIANLMGDRNIWSAIVFALANAGEAMLTAWLIERYVGPNFNLGRLSHVVGLMAAAIVSPAMSGIVGTLGFIFFHNSSADILTTWRHWFISDAIGIITVAPLAIGLASAVRDPPAQREVVVGSAALVVVAAASMILILLPLTSFKTVTPVALLFPLLLWPAARCRPAFAAAASFIVSLFIVWGITFQLGPFGDPGLSMDTRIVSAQITILSVMLCTFVSASLFFERRDHATAIETSEARLQEALKAGGVTAFDWDVRSGLSQRSANAVQMLGLGPQEALDESTFLARVHPDDRARFKELLHGLGPKNPSYKATFRYTRPDGEELWLEESAEAEFDNSGCITRLTGLTVDVSARERAERHQRILMAELDHRVKNVLAGISMIVTASRRGRDSIDEFVRTLEGRLHSKARAHALLSESRWNSVDLRQLVNEQLASYTKDAVTTSGADVMLPPAATEAVSMALHELATNAAKYGALSTPGGRVSVSWDREADENGKPRLIIVWQEFGGPPIAAESSRSGFGTKLIRELIPHEIGGTVDWTPAPEGVYCRMVIPLERA
jgi:PAS domain S-box-containing protein